MALHIVNHPIAEHVLASLRDHETTTAAYRSLGHRIGSLLFAKAFENLATKEIQVRTPLENCTCKTLALDRNIVLVPILRAGLALLNPALELLPEAMVGYIGLQRNEKTSQSELYYKKFPTIADADVFILDPIIATGGTSGQAIRMLQELKPRNISLVSIISAPEGIGYLMDNFPDMDIFTVAMDQRLNENKFILPGLGDFGDRFNGTL
jgi:uracil phosphoribosyltransferase